MKFNLLLCCIILLSLAMNAQITKPTTPKGKVPPAKKIKLINADLEEVNQNVFNGNMVYSGNVVFEHETSRIAADSVIYFQQDNKVEARGNVHFTDKASTLDCKKLIYDGNSRIATALEKVKLTDPRQTVETEKLEYDSQLDMAYFNNWGTINDGQTITHTKSARYFVKEGRIELSENTKMENKDYTLEGTDINFNNKTQISEVNSFTRITEKKNPRNYFTLEKGTYNSKTKEIFGKKNNKIYNNGKILSNDEEMYFNQNTGYGWAKKNVKLEDPKENRWIKGDYGEVYQLKDSAMITGNAYAVKAFDKDSLYFHSAKITAARDKNKLSVLRGYNNARFFKSNASGKSDSLVYHESIGRIDFYKKPIFWSSGKQITGDTISAYISNKTQKIDSVYVRYNAFAISKVDTLSSKPEFNQVKGKKMKAYFLEEELHDALVEENAQSIAFVDDEDKKTKQKSRVGIGKSVCGIIDADFVDRKLNIVSCKINAESKIYPESKIEERMRFLPGFIWRESEKLNKWQDIFIEEDNTKTIDTAVNSEEQKAVIPTREELAKEIKKQYNIDVKVTEDTNDEVKKETSEEQKKIDKQQKTQK